MIPRYEFERKYHDTAENMKNFGFYTHESAMNRLYDEYQNLKSLTKFNETLEEWGLS